MISRLALTGHRPHKLGGYSVEVYDRLLDVALTALCTVKPDVVISGMALGWDTAGAEAAIVLGIPLHAYIPFKGQESKWPPESQRFYNILLRRAEVVKECSPPGYSAQKMQYRNTCMVDDCDRLLALWDGSEGGTANCVNYAISRGKNILNVWQEWAIHYG